MKTKQALIMTGVLACLIAIASAIETPSGNCGENQCTRQNPCTNGYGDCDNNAECTPGARCTANIGARYGCERWVDICIGGQSTTTRQTTTTISTSTTSSSTTITAPSTTICIGCYDQNPARDKCLQDGYQWMQINTTYNGHPETIGICYCNEWDYYYGLCPTTG